jgi:hypothetical protein
VPSCLGLKGWVLKGAVGGVDGDAGRDDLDPVENVVGEDDFGGVELGLELFHGAGADQGRGDRRMGFREGDGELDEGEPGLLGELCQLLDGVELALVVGVG